MIEAYLAGEEVNKVDLLYAQLARLVEQLNSKLPVQLILHQQQKVKAHISVSGANGRLWVSPSIDGYDVSISGLSLEKQLSSQLKTHFRSEPHGYKQTNSNKGFKRQPFWRTSDFKDVENVCEMYAKTSKC